MISGEEHSWKNAQYVQRPWGKCLAVWAVSTRLAWLGCLFGRSVIAQTSTEHLQVLSLVLDTEEIMVTSSDQELPSGISCFCGETNRSKTAKDETGWASLLLCESALPLLCHWLLLPWNDSPFHSGQEPESSWWPAVWSWALQALPTGRFTSLLAPPPLQPGTVPPQGPCSVCSHGRACPSPQTSAGSAPLLLCGAHCNTLFKNMPPRPPCHAWFFFFFFIKKQLYTF